MADNKKNKTETNANMSKSKAKRQDRRKEVEKAQRRKKISRIVTGAVTAVVVAALVFVVGRQIYIVANRTAPAADFSAGLAADGSIEGISALSYVTLPDYENISIPEEEVAATTEEVDNRINSLLTSYKELSTDADLVIADGDEVNLDYVGTVDGVEFEGGNSQGAGYNVTIGSGRLVDDFEQQLIGHKPGEELTVEVTFPEDYSEELGGKDASFAVTIHGIMITPELTDEFVAEHFSESDGISTAADYRARVENEFYQSHLAEYLTNYVLENTTVDSYPDKYVKAVKSVLKYADADAAQTEDETAYEKELTERAQENAKNALAYQAVFEKAGLTFDAQEYFTQMSEQSGEDYVNSLREYYGEAYMAQNQRRQLVVDYLVGLYTS